MQAIDNSGYERARVGFGEILRVDSLDYPHFVGKRYQSLSSEAEIQAKLIFGLDRVGVEVCSQDSIYWKVIDDAPPRDSEERF